MTNQITRNIESRLHLKQKVVQKSLESDSSKPNTVNKIFHRDFCLMSVYTLSKPCRSPEKHVLLCRINCGLKTKV